jgi:predicted ATP-grasp superfamily ATP-dependent carboligase
MPPAEAVLICALSGRALARSARAAGFAPIVLDAFGDLDTREAAAAWRRVPVGPRWRFRRAPLLAAAARLAPPPVPLVWGSGFERAPDLLAELAGGRPLWGTEPAAVRAAKDPIRFAAVARELGVPHPEVRSQAPDSQRGWLCKRAGGAGGSHVHRAGPRPPRGRGWYWQRETRGRAVSALVAGHGSSGAAVLGTSEQQPGSLPGRRRFRFGGAVAPARLTAGALARLAEAAAALAERHGVKGLASIDALVVGDRVTVLEINPRPGATLDAYEQAYAVNLFDLHRRACEGSLPKAPLEPRHAAGSRIVHAQRTVRIPPGFVWPDWAADRTPALTRVRAGGPICTVLAQAGDAGAIWELLAARAEALHAALDRAIACAAAVSDGRRAQQTGIGTP